MISTNKMTERLATHRIESEPPITGRGYRAPSLLDRLSKEGARRDALLRFCANAKRKPAVIYDAQRAEPRSSLPCERLHAVIMQGIDDGWATPETLADYFGELFAIYRAMMPGAADGCYVDVVREKAEAMDKVSVARAIPTPENIACATRELLEDVIVSTAYAKRANA